MCRKLIYLISFVLVLVTGPIRAVEPVRYYPFDNSAEDAAGQWDLIIGGDAEYSSEAMVGSHSLKLSGTGYAILDGLIAGLSPHPRSVAMWVKSDKPTSAELQLLYHETRGTPGHAIWIQGGQLHVYCRDFAGTTRSSWITRVPPGTTLPLPLSPGR